MDSKVKFVSILVLFFSTFFCALCAHAQEINPSVFGKFDAALVIYNRETNAVININPERSSQRFAPCSTFKIYNSLIGLELALIKSVDSPWYEWDGRPRFIEGWNHNLTLREAFRVSCVPAYQILARQIGEERMKSFIEKIGYGTKDISAGIDIFWLNRPGTKPIKISADEQIDLLNRFLDGTLPFKEENVASVREIMKVVETEKGTLYGKTGSDMDEDDKWSLGWFVGFLETTDATYVFACNITGGEEPSGKEARAIVEKVFQSEGLL